ncbi:MAG: transcription elongation factor Spt5 [Candidatus Micrarchaeia archaeon]
MGYYALRVTAGQEKIVADLLRNKIGKLKLNIPSLLVLEGFKGYIIVEAADEGEVRKLAFQVPNVKGVLPGEVAADEIKKMIETKPQMYSLAKGDVVEVINGPFKGDRAKVLKIDLEKEEATIELLEVTVPIPITTKLSWLKVHQKAEEEGGKNV